MAEKRSGGSKGGSNTTSTSTGPAAGGKDKPRPSSGPSLIEAAIKVLTGCKAGMNCTEIVKAAIEKKFWTPKTGLTPQNTLYSNFLSEIKRENSGGKPSRFKKVGKGLWTLK